MEMHRKRKRDQEICRKPVMNPFLSAKFVREFEKKTCFALLSNLIVPHSNHSHGCKIHKACFCQ
jgi:hypothetical protein